MTGAQDVHLDFHTAPDQARPVLFVVRSLDLFNLVNAELSPEKVLAGTEVTGGVCVCLCVCVCVSVCV